MPHYQLNRSPDVSPEGGCLGAVLGFLACVVAAGLVLAYVWTR